MYQEKLKQKGGIDNIDIDLEDLEDINNFIKDMKIIINDVYDGDFNNHYIFENIFNNLENDNEYNEFFFDFYMVLATKIFEFLIWNRNDDEIYNKFIYRNKFNDRKIHKEDIIKYYEDNKDDNINEEENLINMSVLINNNPIKELLYHIKEIISIIYGYDKDKTLHFYNILARNLKVYFIEHKKELSEGGTEISEEEKGMSDEEENMMIPKEKKGKGIIQKRKNKIIELGRIKILYDKLYNDNILSIRDENNYKYKYLGNTKISDDLTDIIINMCNGREIKKNEINLLNDDEKDLYNLVVRLSKTNKKFINNIDDTKNNIKNKYNIIIGEIEAGNNNDKLLIDLKKIMERMTHIGLISYNQFKTHFKEIKDNYFK